MLVVIFAATRFYNGSLHQRPQTYTRPYREHALPHPTSNETRSHGFQNRYRPIIHFANHEVNIQEASSNTSPPRSLSAAEKFHSKTLQSDSKGVGGSFTCNKQPPTRVLGRRSQRYNLSKQSAPPQGHTNVSTPTMVGRETPPAPPIHIRPNRHHTYP